MWTGECVGGRVGVWAGEFVDGGWVCGQESVSL